MAWIKRQGRPPRPHRRSTPQGLLWKQLAIREHSDKVLKSLARRHGGASQSSLARMAIRRFPPDRPIKPHDFTRRWRRVRHNFLLSPKDMAKLEALAGKYLVTQATVLEACLIGLRTQHLKPTRTFPISEKSPIQETKDDG